MNNLKPKAQTAPASETEFARCACNKLLCVIRGQDIEIKCNKCKRVMTISTRGITEIKIT